MQLPNRFGKQLEPHHHTRYRPLPEPIWNHDMPHYLPDSLYYRNRLIQISDTEFRLSESEKMRLFALEQGTRIEKPDDCQDTQDKDPFLTLPWAYRQLEWLVSQLMDSRESEKQIRQLAGKLCNLARNAPDATLAAGLLLPYPHYSYAHAVHVALLVARLTERLEFPEATIQSLVCAGLTMNIAMVDMQQQLSHQAEALSELQSKQLRLHPLTGSAMLREAGIEDETWHLAIIEHHEQWNGKGYPFGLGKKNISIGAHILHVADIAMARLHPRHYRRPQMPKSAMIQFFQQRGALNDALLTECLVKEIGLYPPGSFVKLEQGETAIVVHHGPDITTPLSVRLSRGAGTIAEANSVASPAQMRIEARHLPVLAKLWDCQISDKFG